MTICIVIGCNYKYNLPHCLFNTPTDTPKNGRWYRTFPGWFGQLFFLGLQAFLFPRLLSFMLPAVWSRIIRITCPFFIFSAKHKNRCQCDMPRTASNQKQANFLYRDLLEQLDPKAPLLALSRRLPWETFEKEFAPFYAEIGRPAKPIRLMVRLLLLKQIRKCIGEEQEALTARHEEFMLYRRAVNQERNDKNKVYSLHEPSVCCIGKGKAHKKYEFGSKASIVMTKTNCMVVGAKNFSHNEYDGNTLEDVLYQVKSIRGTSPEMAFCDRGFRGKKKVGDTVIAIPESPSPKTTEHFKRKARKNFGRRSAIEPVIGHLKTDFRMARNYLKGTVGDAINLLMAAAAFNCKKWMNALADGLFFVFFALFTRDTAMQHKDER